MCPGVPAADPHQPTCRMLAVMAVPGPDLLTTLAHRPSSLVSIPSAPTAAAVVVNLARKYRVQLPVLTAVAQVSRLGGSGGIGKR